MNQDIGKRFELLTYSINLTTKLVKLAFYFHF